MRKNSRSLSLIGLTFIFILGCRAVSTVTDPTLLPTPFPAPAIEPSSVPTSTTAIEILTGYGLPSVSATLYGDAGNYDLQAGIQAQVTWPEAPPAADSYQFTLTLHSDNSLLIIGTDVDDSDGISVDWLIPENTSGALQAIAYFADGREVRSFKIDVYTDKAVPAGACVVRSHTIAALSVYQEPSDTAQIIGVMHPTSMVEVVGKNTNGWYKINTNEVNTQGNFDQKIGPGTAWLYETWTELFGACGNLPVLETANPSTGACTDPGLGISYQVPTNWDTRLDKPGDFQTSLASFNLSNPPHKLLWNTTTVQIDLRRLETIPASVDEWVESAKNYYNVDGTSLWVYERETQLLENQNSLEHLTLVSGSGGVLHLVYLPIGEKHLEILVQGNFELAVPLFNTIIACNL